MLLFFFIYKKSHFLIEKCPSVAAQVKIYSLKYETCCYKDSQNILPPRLSEASTITIGNATDIPVVDLYVFLFRKA